MKYYSEKLNKLYDSVETLKKAEAAALEAENRAKMEAESKKAREEQLAAERKIRAAEVEKARKAMVEAQKAYKDLLTKFINDYHTYHFSTTSAEDFPTLIDLFNQLF